MKSILILIPILSLKGPLASYESKISLSQLAEFGTLTNKPLQMNAIHLTYRQEKELLKKITDWKIDRTDIHRLSQVFNFRSHKKLLEFEQAIYESVVDSYSYRNLNIFVFNTSILIELYTPDVMGLTENDFILAARISTLKFLHFFYG